MRAKYVLLACGIAVFTAGLFGNVNYHWVKRLTLERAIDKLTREAELIAPRIKANFDRVHYDAVMVSRTPPFPGLVRSTQNDGVDPFDASTTRQWEERLKTIFASMMRHRPEYVQMRYIGVADGGREIVRTDRQDKHIFHVAREKLQRKAREPYFQDSLKLQTGEVHFSKVTPNSDHGEVQEDMPMLRVVTPIHDDEGRLFGFMVINVHYGILLSQALSGITANEDLFIVNEAGNFMKRSVDGTLSDFAFSPDGASAASQEIVTAVRELDGQNSTLLRVVDGQDMVISQASFAFASEDSGRFVSVVLAAPSQTVLADANVTRARAIWLSIALVVAASLLAFAATGFLTRPLWATIHAIRAYRPGQSSLDLATGRQDELGELSRAFTELVSRLEEARDTQASMLARLEAIVDNTIDGLITIDEWGTVTNYNRGAGGIFGYRPDEVIGQNVKVLMPAPQSARHDEHLHRHRKTGEYRVIGTVREVDGLTKGGRVIPIEISVSEVMLPSGKHFSGIVRDISERKCLERAIRDNAAALERSNRDLEEFAYIASHDLKEPLRAIRNHVQFLAEDCGDTLDESSLNRIERLKQLCVRSDKLIGDLLHFSRLGRAELDHEPIDMDKVVEELREGLADTLTERNATIKIASPLPQAIGDRSRIASLLHNLIVNGIKYNDQAEKSVEIGFNEDLPCGNGSKGGYFVRDNGIGIQSEFKDSVFMIFKRLHNDKAYGPGTGAGLSFARKIVERHGGRLWFESEPGNGTTFYFNLSGLAQ